MPPIVEFERVTKLFRPAWPWRPGVRALDDVSFSIAAGETFGVMGPNRAGKTTLIKALLSICRVTSGTVRRFGLDSSRRSTLARIGYLHESQAFPRYLTAIELLEFYGALSGVSAGELRTRVPRLLDRVGLASRSREPIGRFSKGMLQRLALAQSLLNEPQLLVLDEPAEGLDLRARRLLTTILGERRAQGATTILVSHAPADVQRLCNRVAVLGDGKLAFLGSVDELIRRTKPSPAAAALRAATSGASSHEGALPLTRDLRRDSQDAAGACDLESALDPFYEEALA